MSAMDAPEGLDHQVFGSGGVADDAQNPPVYRTLMLAEESFECIEIAKPEAVQYAVRPNDDRALGHLTSLSDWVYAGVGRKVTTAGVRVQVSGVRVQVSGVRVQVSGVRGQVSVDGEQQTANSRRWTVVSFQLRASSSFKNDSGLTRWKAAGTGRAE
jgi:hypothetical protein